MKLYKVWLVVLTPLLQDKICSILVNAKIGVSSMNKCGDICHESDITDLSAYTFAFKLSFNEPKVGSFGDKLVELFHKKEIRYLSLIIVDDDGNAEWFGSTYKYEKPEFIVNYGPYRSSAN